MAAVPGVLVFGRTSGHAQTVEATIEVTIEPTTVPEVTPEPSPSPSPSPPPPTETPETVPTLAPTVTAPAAPSATATAAQARASSGSSSKGTLSASVVDAAIGPDDDIPYDPDERVLAGWIELSVRDTRTGASSGWSVSLAVGPFRYSGDGFGADIPAANTSIASVGAPLTGSGEPVGRSGPVAVDSSTGSSLDTPRVVLRGGVGSAPAAVRQVVGIHLIVPARSRPGTYRAEATVTAVSGP